MHVIVFTVVALVVLGPHRLTDVARQAGKFLAEFRGWQATIKDEMHGALNGDAGSNGGSVVAHNGNGAAEATASDGQQQLPLADGAET